MGSRDENFYAAWREGCRATALRDGDAAPPEKLLQAIWLHQRLKRGELKTLAGIPVHTLHPGFASAEGGPDFRGAVVKFGNEPPVTGDVEVDLQTAGWHAHGHDRNPNFKGVVLHVVWDAAQEPRSQGQTRPDVLPLKHHLDAPLSELALSLENESGLPENLRGKCSAPLRELSASQLSELLDAAAKVRFENKAKAILARAKACGWEQALWENLFRALGYKHNAWPMLHLAEQRARLISASPHPCSDSLFTIQARLLGVSGLLPDDLTRPRKSSLTFLRRVWDCWWRDRDGFCDCILPRAIWKFHGLRPANHPQRRLALAAHWLAAGTIPEHLEEWISQDISDGRAALPRRRVDRQVSPTNRGPLASLHKIFQTGGDEFWSWHWTFTSPRLPTPQPLLGVARMTDLAVNVVLPWLWIRSKEGGNEKIQLEIERRFFAWPAAADNSILKLARQRLLGASNPKILESAAQQQGLMQIVRDFCDHSNAICGDCRFPDLVRGWRARL